MSRVEKIKAAKPAAVLNHVLEGGTDYVEDRPAEEYDAVVAAVRKLPPAKIEAGIGKVREDWRVYLELHRHPADATPDTLNTEYAHVVRNKLKLLTEALTGEPAKFADEKVTALAGEDGRELARLVRESVAEGRDVLTDVARSALERAFKGGGGVPGTLFDDGERGRLADALAGVNATADLLGRSRVRELADRADAPAFRTFADSPPIRIMPPERAVDYFRSLVPSLGVDPSRFGESMRRRAFTLAADTEGVILDRVRKAVRAALVAGKSTDDAAADVDSLLESAGLAPSNPQYGEMVFRTNAHDAYTTAAYEEMRAPDVRDQFPAWEYLGVNDSRTGADHRPKIGKFYPAAASFAEVRGDRPFNCRCNFRPVTLDEWDEIQSRGGRAETTW